MRDALTHLQKRRSEYDVGIAYGADIATATAFLLAAMNAVDGVPESPEPDVVSIALGNSAVSLRARSWTNSAWSDVIATKGALVQEIKRRLDEEGVEIPFPPAGAQAGGPRRHHALHRRHR